MSALERLAQLKGELAAIEAEINLIEAGISRAAYDASIAAQLVTINDQRTSAGQPTLTMSQFLAGNE